MTFAVEMSGIRIRAFDNADGTYSLAVGNKVYPNVKTGELVSGTAALQGPDIPAELVMLWTGIGNAGTVYWGGSGITTPNGTADATTGLPLIANESTPYLPIDNVNKIYHIASAASQQLFYVALS